MNPIRISPVSFAPRFGNTDTVKTDRLTSLVGKKLVWGGRPVSVTQTSRGFQVTVSQGEQITDQYVVDGNGRVTSSKIGAPPSGSGAKPTPGKTPAQYLQEILDATAPAVNS